MGGASILKSPTQRRLGLSPGGTFAGGTGTFAKLDFRHSQLGLSSFPAGTFVTPSWDFCMASWDFCHAQLVLLPFPSGTFVNPSWEFCLSQLGLLPSQLGLLPFPVGTFAQPAGTGTFAKWDF